MRARNKFLLLSALAGLVSCSRMATPPATQLLKDAEARASSGDYLVAIDLYERALDGSVRSAEIHYRLALLYDDKMHDSLNAIHHFKRCLTIVPSGPRAEEVKKLMKRDELALVTELSGDSVVTRAEAARLKNENLDLRKALDEARSETHNAARAEKVASKATRKKPIARTTKSSRH